MLGVKVLSAGERRYEYGVGGLGARRKHVMLS